jgi:hypothetical protein
MTMSHSDTDNYGSEHESVDLGQQLGQPKVSDSGRDLADATSQSPQAQRNGAADPQMFAPEHGDYWPEPGRDDAINSGAWGNGARYVTKYEPKS